VLLLIDNYDSFVHNLARYFVCLGQEVRTVRHDAFSLDEIAAEPPAAIVISPGPKAPRDAGLSIATIERFAGSIPILGVCLGHQAIVEAFGGRTVRAPAPVHGMTSRVRHFGTHLYRDLPDPLEVCRYHSLVADRRRLPAALVVDGQTDDGIVMSVRHRELPVFGVQYHPESALTPQGATLLANFLREAGLLTANVDQPRIGNPSLI
jgi:anthranilate synthase component 2